MIPKNEYVSIYDFAKLHGLEFDVRKADPSNRHSAYLASFRGAETLKGTKILVSAHGVGETPEVAIADYAFEISFARLVVDAELPSRREIDVPLLHGRKSALRRFFDRVRRIFSRGTP